MAPIAPIPPMSPLVQAAQAQGPSAADLATAATAQLGQGSGAAGSAPLATFQEFFADAVKTASNLDAQSSQQQQKLLVGDVDNLHDVFIAMEKADLAFQLTMAVRDKVISAYQTVMQMSV
jgi:flagellar hook-basal body complex protein FliE